MHSLIHQLASARDRALRTPFTFVTEASSVPVPRAHVQDRPVPLGSCVGERALDTRVKAMVEPDLDHPAGGCGNFLDSPDVARPDPGGLLDEDVRAGNKCLAGGLGEPVVRNGDDDDVGALLEQLIQRPGRRPSELGGERARSAGIHVERRDELVGP